MTIILAHLVTGGSTMVSSSLKKVYFLLLGLGLGCVCLGCVVAPICVKTRMDHQKFEYSMENDSK